MASSGLGFEVDRELCTGSGSCAFHAPGTFDLDDEMKVVVLGEADAAADTNDAAAVAAAIDSCPSRALRRRETP
ncbi:ferredoxin [Frankia sp. CNm7]|uniref:Ferredoxin n=1 Tax=Frankia nepalensis TaxID=1836974 RepID=A0A937UMX6_9ACTN|nr:ferredoxin [Frankia nepalensis]MBL7496383.1 ferredoxin [Frankia nepalensis]MBL7511467.1 ferredoxin [Frankia nepalensis]MBL7523873.1 ferredoxin [Frankia nepalensis]MBL7627332.1 ferredoxin [Frankia nepalensis]